MRLGALRARGFGLTQVLAGTLALLFVVLLCLLFYAFHNSGSGRKVGLGEVNRLADAGQVYDATLLDQDSQILGRACAGRISTPSGVASDPRLRRCEGKLAAFHASYPRSDVGTQALIERISRQAPLSVDLQNGKAVAKLVATFLVPLLILANLFALIFLLKSRGDGLSDIVGFGTLSSRRARQRQAETGVTFADVAGADEAVDELREVIDYLSDPKRFEAYGAAPPKGVILFGPPGCGKTLVARAVAGETGVPFLSISGTEFVESLVGVGAARVRDLFQKVRAIAPAIVFIDEVDAVGRRREGEGFSGGEREQTLNQLLVEMDGFDVSTGIVVMAATNRPDILDPALLRPGRFDRHVTLEPPDIAGRAEILRIHARGKPLAPEADLNVVARNTAGFTGADLANVINEATLLAIREGPGTEVGPSHLGEAVQRVLHGPQRRGRLMSPGERRRIAVHEAGHAVAAAALGRASSVSRVSVVARGGGLGQTVLDGASERVLLTSSEMASTIAAAMGGIAAETLVFGETSTTSEHDIDRANDVAREMVGRYGMAGRRRWLRVLAHRNGYLGASSAVEAVSGRTLADFDDEVAELLDAAQAHALAAVATNRPQLDAVVERLESVETLEGTELSALLARVVPVSGPEVDSEMGASDR